MLNWPQLPVEYHITEEAVMDKTLLPAHPFPHYQYYRQYNYNYSILEDHLQPLFNFDITNRVFIQIIKKGISIHKDTGRKIIYNYLIDTGGANVYTHFFDEDKKTELYSVNIPVNAWHKMDVSYYHNVTGITHNRIAITIYNTY
jgi:hypothetical protein